MPSVAKSPGMGAQLAAQPPGVSTMQPTQWCGYAWPRRLPPPLPLAESLIGFSGRLQHPTIGQLAHPFFPRDISWTADREHLFQQPHQDIKPGAPPLSHPSAVPHPTQSFAMEFYSAEELERIQQVADLLGLSPEELIQQRRVSHSNARQFPTHHHVADPSTHLPISQPPQDLSADGGAPLSWQHVHVIHRHESMDVDSFEVEEDAAQLSAPSAASGETHDHDTEVILLNPQTVWYDCDAPLWNLEEAPPPDEAVPFEGDGAESFVSVTPTQVDLDMESISATQELRPERDPENTGTDSGWALVSSSPGSMSSFQTPMSPTAVSADKRYHIIAPKSGRPGSLSGSASQSHSSSPKVRKKRSPYQGAKKRDTHLTRQVHACVRCRMQRNRVCRLQRYSFLLISDFHCSASPTPSILVGHA